MKHFFAARWDGGLNILAIRTKLIGASLHCGAGIFLYVFLPGLCVWLARGNRRSDPIHWGFIRSGNTGRAVRCFPNL